MQFNRLIAELQKVHEFNLWQGDKKIFDASLTGITCASAEVKPGYIFAAIQGLRLNGIKFIPEAIERGASIIVSSTAGYQQYSDQFPTLTFIETDNPKRCLALLASIFYPKAPANIVAVTGTNGKSSTVDFVRQIWETLSFRAASVGTLGTISKHYKAKKHLTTPDPVFLHRTMQELVEHKVTHVAIEASSHGIDQRRLDGLKLAAGGFTSFGHDHLDYHKTVEQYFNAKAALFSRLLQDTMGVSVINADLPEFEKLKQAARGLPLISYGRKGKEIKLHSITPNPKGQKLSLTVFEEDYEVLLPLIGEFQVMNALCALGLVLNDIDIDTKKAVHALENLKSSPGRVEFIGHTKEGASIYVDYAHPPPAIETILTDLKKHTKNHLWIILGAGGGRDPSTRQPMGEKAATYADHVIITDDNPRFEEPDLIRETIMKGAPDAIDIANRKDAIQYAINHAAQGDLILVTGKGPEDGQIYADRIEPFLDKEVILKLIHESTPHEK